MEVIVPDGISGSWRVETFTVSQKESHATLLRSMLKEDNYHYVPPGEYRRLVCGNQVVMSNTPAEVKTNLEFISRAKGNVLINGLGLGMVVHAILQKPEVWRVTIIEKEPDVIKLVWPSFMKDSRTCLYCADALTWQARPGEFFDVVWHDIWPNITENNLEEMKLLHRRYGHRCGWQASWARDRCEALRRNAKRAMEFPPSLLNNFSGVFANVITPDNL